jgi:basic amino acid/polyamine antiporter, APA family
MNDNHQQSAAEPRPGLVRALGPWMATAVVVGTVIGSGVFKKPQAVAQNVPDFLWVAAVWVVGGFLTFLGTLTIIEVAVMFPRAGGNYVFLREGYGRLAGFLWGWVDFWIIRAGSLAALATIFTESLHDILKQTLGGGDDALSFWEQRLLTVTILLGLALVNIRGVRWGGGLQFFITCVKVISLLGILLLPFVFMALGRSLGENAPVAITSPPFKVPTEISLAGFLSALLGVLWAYHGWMNLGPVGAEIRNPQRNIPLALVGGVGLIIFLYLGANLAYNLILSHEEIASVKDTPVATAFSVRLLGSIGAVIMSAAVMCSVFGALNGNLLVGPRLLYAMGEDGLAPRSLGAVHPRFHTPANAILVTAGWAIGLIIGVTLLTWFDVLKKDKAHFDILTDFVMFGVVIFETLAVSTIFVFRRTLPNVERTYRCPGYPWVPALYMILPALVLGNMFVNHRLEALVGLGFIGVGAVVFFLFLQKPKTGAPTPEPVPAGRS